MTQKVVRRIVEKSTYVYDSKGFRVSELNETDITETLTRDEGPKVAKEGK